jgi:hypothetical protein
VAAGLALLSITPLRVRLDRAYIEEVYFGRAGALDRTRGALPLPAVEAARRALEERLAPTPWRF